MGIVRKFLVIIVASYTLAGCTPIGSVYDGQERSLWAVPRRQVYNIGQNFDLDKDVWVFFSYPMGTVEPVDVSRVSIHIYPNTNSNQPIPVPYPRLFLTSQVGKGNKTVRITYEGKIAEYSIEVNDPQGLVDEEDEDGFNVGGGGMGIIWAD